MSSGRKRGVTRPKICSARFPDSLTIFSKTGCIPSRAGRYYHLPNAMLNCDPITEDVGSPVHLVGGRESGLQGVTTERRSSTLHVENANFNVVNAGGASNDVLLPLTYHIFPTKLPSAPHGIVDETTFTLRQTIEPFPWYRLFFSDSLQSKLMTQEIGRT